MAGPTTSLPASKLRSSGPEVPGSDPGTTPLAEIINAIPPFMAIAATSDLPIDLDEVPLAEVEPAWHRRGGRQRIVLRPSPRAGHWHAERQHLDGARVDQNSARDHPDRRVGARSV